MTQSATTVIGTPGNDSIDCSAADPGKQISGLVGDDTITGTAFGDTINGDAGSDSLTGPPDDLSVDRVNGGLGTDVCQGPGLDRDILTGCP